MVFNKLNVNLFIAICFALMSCCYPCKKDAKIQSECITKINNTVVTNFEIKGISYVATNSVIDSSNIAPIKKVNCNWISQMPFAFCQLNSTQVTYDPLNQWWGETDAGISITTKLAKQQNIKTMLKPQLWVNGSYTGAFTLSNEADWQTWENNYRNYILHFAHLADSLNIEMFCIGTELKLVVQNRPTLFTNLIDTIRTFYNGKLIYAANWDDYKNLSFWSKLDYIGIDGYFPLSSAITPSVDELVSAWQTKISEIDQFRIIQNKEIIFTEIGYKSVNQCAYEPWNSTASVLNIKAQNNSLQAFFKAFANKKWFIGAFIWKWYPNHQIAGGLSDKDYTPQNKPLEAIIKKCFSTVKK